MFEPSLEVLSLVATHDITMYAQLDQYTLQASQDSGRQIWENMHGGAGYHRDGGL